MRLSRKWIEKLITLPESGMGYHVVDVILKNGTVVRGMMVLNCQDIMGAVYFSEDDIADIVANA